MKRETVHVKDLAAPVGPFSYAVRHGGEVFVSGTVAQDPKTGTLIEGDVAMQTKQVLTNLRTILKSANKSFDDVLKVTIYLTDMRDYPAMNEVYAHAFAMPYPARTCIAVADLQLGALVEIELVTR